MSVDALEKADREAKHWRRNSRRWDPQLRGWLARGAVCPSLWSNTVPRILCGKGLDL